MFYYLLGIITGLVLSLIVFISSKKGDYAQKIEELSRDFPKITKKQVEFLEPINEKVEAIAEIFKENDKKGRDTKIDEL